MKMRNIKKEMMEIKLGDFQEWYDNLTKEELKIYKEEFEKLQLLEDINRKTENNENNL